MMQLQRKAVSWLGDPYAAHQCVSAAACTGANTDCAHVSEYSVLAAAQPVTRRIKAI